MMKALTAVDEDLDQMTDEELLTRYRDEGRPEDFNALVRRYERELYRYLARYLGDKSLADDVFQNTFLQVHLKRGLYESGRPVRPGSTRLPLTRPSTRFEKLAGTRRSAWTCGRHQANPTQVPWSTSW